MGGEVPTTLWIYEKTVSKLSCRSSRAQFQHYAEVLFHRHCYSIISWGRWMRGEQFYPIPASGGASSKAFWPGLLPWGTAILQETHQTHERRTSRVTLLCLHNNNPHLPDQQFISVVLYTKAYRNCWKILLGFSFIWSTFQAACWEKSWFKCSYNFSFKFDQINKQSLDIFLSKCSKSEEPHTQENIKKNIILWLYFKALTQFFGAVQIHFPRYSILCVHISNTANSYGHLLHSLTYSTIFSPAVCFPAVGCSRQQYSLGGGRDAAILEAVVHANVCLMSSQRK